MAYVSARGRKALDFTAGHPRLFLANAGRRIWSFWLGLTRPSVPDPFYLLRTLAFAEASLFSLAGLGFMIWVGKRESFLFAALFLFYPLVYYVTFVLTRYRHPIEPEMVLLMAYLLSDYGESRIRGGRPRFAKPCKGR